MLEGVEEAAAHRERHVTSAGIEFRPHLELTDMPLDGSEKQKLQHMPVSVDPELSATHSLEIQAQLGAGLSPPILQMGSGIWEDSLYVPSGEAGGIKYSALKAPREEYSRKQIPITSLAGEREKRLRGEMSTSGQMGNYSTLP